MRTLICGFIGMIAVATGAHAAGDADEEHINANWIDLSKIDPITDDRRGIAYVKAEDGESSLVLKCDEAGAGSVYVNVISRDYLGEGRSRSRKLIYRFDAEPPVEDSWLYDKSYALNLAPASFVTSLRNAEKVAIRATTYDFGTVDMTFNVSGAAEAIDLVYSACGDTLPV